MENFFASSTPIHHSKLYTIRELVLAICDEKAKSDIFGLAPRFVHSYLQGSSSKYGISCSYKTLQRWVRRYKENSGDLPPSGSFGHERGCPPLVAPNQIQELTATCREKGCTTIGMSDIAHGIATMQGNSNITTNTPHPVTVKKYFVEAAKQTDMAVVKKASTKSSCLRRYVASYSQRNVMSTICTAIYSQFRPGNWDKPPNLPPGSLLAHKLVEDLFGMNMKPVENWQIMNFDMTSYYTCAGIARGQTDHEWRIVSSSAVTKDVKKIRSATQQEDESKFNGITVKWCDAVAASGQIFPMVAIFSGFNESMMPDDSMIVLKIPGMCFGGRIDVFSSSFGYVVL
jgi:transposase